MKGNTQIKLPAFDRSKRVTTVMYELHTSFKNVDVLKELLCQISLDKTNDETFLSYILNSMTSKGMTNRIIIQQNNFPNEMIIVPINDIKVSDENKVIDIFC